MYGTFYRAAWDADVHIWATPVICINPRWPLPTFKNVGTPSISQKRLKLETWNLVCG